MFQPRYPFRYCQSWVGLRVKTHTACPSTNPSANKGKMLSFVDDPLHRQKRCLSTGFFSHLRIVWCMQGMIILSLFSGAFFYHFQMPEGFTEQWLPFGGHSRRLHYRDDIHGPGLPLQPSNG